MFASFTTLMSSLFPSVEQQAAMSTEQKIFLGHFHAAFGKLVSSQGGSKTAQPAAGADPDRLPKSQPVAAGIHRAPESKPPSSGDECAENVAKEPASPCEVGVAPADALPAFNGVAEDPQASQAMFLGQMLLSMSHVFPGMAASISAMTNLMAGTPVIAGNTAATAAAPVLPIVPLAGLHAGATAGAPQYVQTTLGNVLAARIAGTAPKGIPQCADPNASTPHKNILEKTASGLQLQTPTTLQPVRPSSASRVKTEGSALAFLAMAASMEGAE